jgi:hypothetical protein
MGHLIVLKPDGSRDEIEQATYPTLEQLQKLVGGYIELQHVDFRDALREMFINEDGKRENLPVNEEATRVWLRGRQYMRGRDVIVGPAVIVVGLVEPQDTD